MNTLKLLKIYNKETKEYDLEIESNEAYKKSLIKIYTELLELFDNSVDNKIEIHKVFKYEPQLTRNIPNRKKPKQMTNNEFKILIDSLLELKTLNILTENNFNSLIENMLLNNTLMTKGQHIYLTLLIK